MANSPMVGWALDSGSGMFNTLLESKATKQRSPGGAAFSVVSHVVLISLAVYATAHAAIKNEKEKVEKIEFAQVKKAPPPPPKPPPPQATLAPPPPKGFQVLKAPIDIPDVIPDVDLTKRVTDEADFTGKGVAGGNAKGTTTKGPASDQPYFDFQVEKQAGPVPGNPSPRYPEMLHSAGVEGEVLAQFVIDTSGRADMSAFKVIKTSHEQFAEAVKEALPHMRFYPAEVGNHKVKELVQQAFAFTITR
jgi:periplasmic protein TonB